MRSSTIPSPTSSPSGNRRRSRAQPTRAIARRGAHDAPNASVVAPAVFAHTQNRSVSTIQPIGCAIHCEYSVYRMIFSPRVAPM